MTILEFKMDSGESLYVSDDGVRLVAHYQDRIEIDFGSFRLRSQLPSAFYEILELLEGEDPKPNFFQVSGLWEFVRKAVEE